MAPHRSFAPASPSPGADRAHPSEAPLRQGTALLLSDECMAEVESAMMRLAVGARFARLGVIVQEHLQGGGRRMRARLALAAAEALGLDRAAAIPWAAACELLHNATLLHDDVQDGDRVRRDQPTAWVRHGVGQAINAGDLLLMLPTVVLSELQASDAVKWRLAEALARAAERTVRGQSAEMDLTAGGRIGWEDWSWAAEGKTGALLALPVEGAAILAGLDAATASRLAAPFGAIGLLYQMADDLVDLTLAKGHGRRAGDVREGRITSLVATHCALHPAEAADLLDLLRDPARRTEEATVQAVVRRFVSGGAVQALLARMERSSGLVTSNPTLRAVPDLHGLATSLLRGFVQAPLLSLGKVSS